MPSVFVSPTDCIAVTDGINPSVKLDNVVVIADCSNHNNKQKPAREIFPAHAKWRPRKSMTFIDFSEE
jgi:hypothetical protein